MSTFSRTNRRIRRKSPKRCSLFGGPRRGRKESRSRPIDADDSEVVTEVDHLGSSPWLEVKSINVCNSCARAAHGLPGSPTTMRAYARSPSDVDAVTL